MVFMTGLHEEESGNSPRILRSFPLGSSGTVAADGPEGPVRQCGHSCGLWKNTIRRPTFRGT